MDIAAWNSIKPAATDLSHAPSFALGKLQIDPPARRISNGARSEMVEPRVMRVLVALGETPGRVLSRDDLIDVCWDGQVVGDSAITRVVSMLRRTLSELSDETIRIETITKVGFRLLVDGHASTLGDVGAADDTQSEPSEWRRETASSFWHRKWTRRAGFLV